jgi:hypothetical protein
MSAKPDARIVEKIQKLMRLAKDGGASENEAATAARMAEAMMRKHNLEHADVIIEEVKDKANMDRSWSRPTSRKNAPRANKDLPSWAESLCVYVAELFDCHACKQIVDLPQGKCMVVVFYGYKDDVKMCAWIYDYLCDTIRRLAKQFEKDHCAGSDNAETRLMVDSFRRGCAQSISMQLDAATKAKTQDNTKSSTGTALVVAKRNAVAQHFGEFSYDKDPEKKEKKKDLIAYAIGRMQGNEVNISPNPLDNKAGNKELQQ